MENKFNKYIDFKLYTFYYQNLTTSSTNYFFYLNVNVNVRIHNYQFLTYSVGYIS